MHGRRRCRVAAAAYRPVPSRCRFCGRADGALTKSSRFRWIVTRYGARVPLRHCPVSRAYRPRRPADDVLCQVVRDHYETFRAAATRRDGEGLPRFIDDEFCGFLRRGQLAAGFPASTAMARSRASMPFSCNSIDVSDGLRGL